MNNFLHSAILSSRSHCSCDLGEGGAKLLLELAANLDIIPRCWFPRQAKYRSQSHKGFHQDVKERPGKSSVRLQSLQSVAGWPMHIYKPKIGPESQDVRDSRNGEHLLARLHAMGGTSPRGSPVVVKNKAVGCGCQRELWSSGELEMGLQGFMFILLRIYFTLVPSFHCVP